MLNSNLDQKIHEDFLEWSKVIDHLYSLTVTPMGKTLAVALRPFERLADAELSLQESAELLQLLKENRLKVHFSDIVDCEPLLRKTDKGGTLSKEDLRPLLISLKSSDALIQELSIFSSAAPHLEPYLRAYKNIDEVVMMLEEIIDARGEIRDSASPELQTIRIKIRELNVNIHGRLKTLLTQQFSEELFQDDYITVREDRLVLPLKANMRGKIKGIIHGSSNTGQTYFIEPEEVIQSNNEFKMACQQEQEEIEKILRNVSKVIHDYKKEISQNLQIIAKLDLMLGKAKLSLKLNGTLPKLNLIDKEFYLKAARHPLMALFTPSANTKTVVPNDLSMPATCCCLMISGPNAGGKTVALKTLGLNSLLASAGILPAVGSGSSLPFCDQILVDMGDHQSIEEGLSTFSAHLKTLQRILKLATPQSLVLLDEIFSGTNAEEGSALAQAFLEELVTHRIKTVVSTHYQNLKGLPLDHQHFMNASVELDGKNGRPTYHLVYGVAGKSNAIKLAKESGIPNRVIDRALALLGPGRQRLENLENEVEKERQLLRTQQLQLTEKTNQLAQLEKELKAKLQAVADNQIEEIIADHLKLKEALAEARRRLREITPSLQAAKALSLQKTLDRISETASHVHQQLPVAQQQRPLKEGDEVKILQSGQIGKLLQTTNRHGQIEISIGMLRMKLHEDEVQLIEKTGATNKSGASSGFSITKSTFAKKPAQA
jgi:DNA mismatch repair protein MutS2